MDSSAVRLICWDAWEAPTVRDVVEAARETQAEVLYLTPPPERSPRNAVAELEALRCLHDPAVVMVTVGEEGMLFRCSFLRGVGKRADLDSEEIGQEMLDAAERQGLRARAVPA